MSLEFAIRAMVERADALARSTLLWPGFRFTAAPLALLGRESAWLVGHPAPPAGYQREGELAGRPVYRGPICPEMTAGPAVAEVAGHPTALVSLSPEVEPYHLLGAAFRLWRQGGAAAPAARERYPVHDPVNNALAIVENEQLVAAMQGDPQGLGRFLSLRLHRQKRMGRTGAGEMVAYEHHMELTEGVPTYVELRAGRPLDELAARLRDCNVGGRWAAFERFAWTGAAQALLLDQVAPGWQARLQGGEGKQQDLLLEAAGDVPAVGGVVREVGFTAVLEREEQTGLARRRERT